MTRTLITGGNKGLGFEAARRLKDLGQTVMIGSRDPERGAAAARELGVDWLPLDVTSDASVAAAAATVRERWGGLDVLINNAGITGARAAVEDIDGPMFSQVLDTNSVSIVRMTHAFLPILRDSSEPVIVNVASGLGSFTMRHDPTVLESKIPSLAYSASKAAVTMLTVIYAQYLPDIRINVVDPGYTATDLNGNSGHQTVEEGTDAIVAMATIGNGGPTGEFRNRYGAVGW